MNRVLCSVLVAVAMAAVVVLVTLIPSWDDEVDSVVKEYPYTSPCTICVDEFNGGFDCYPCEMYDPVHYSVR